jgi:hypothetical protein
MDNLFKKLPIPGYNPEGSFDSEEAQVIKFRRLPVIERAVDAVPSSLEAGPDTRGAISEQPQPAPETAPKTEDSPAPNLVLMDEYRKNLANASLAGTAYDEQAQQQYLGELRQYIDREAA